MNVFPDFLSDALMAKLERDVINSLLSAAYSSYISGLWRSGSAKWATFTGEGQALKDMATATYLSLRMLSAKGIALTVPQDLLEADNLGRFQSEEKTK